MRWSHVQGRGAGHARGSPAGSHVAWSPASQGLQEARAGLAVGGTRGEGWGSGLPRGRGRGSVALRFEVQPEVRFRADSLRADPSA